MGCSPGIVAFLAGALAGAVNGTLVSVVGLQPIVATLAPFVGGRGIALVMAGGQLSRSPTPICWRWAPAASSAYHRPFGTTPSGEDVTLWRLESGTGVNAEILTHGGILHALEVPDTTGATASVVLSLGSLDQSAEHGAAPRCGLPQPRRVPVPASGSRDRRRMSDAPDAGPRGARGSIGGMVERIIAACDGASKGNPGPAAWAWVVSDADGSVVSWEAGPLGRATNNVAELTALLELLRSTDPMTPLEVRMDSQYAMKAVTTWLPGWRRKGWRTASGGPVANQELVMAIDTLLTGRDVTFVHTPAHQVDGDPLNAAADGAASRTAVTQEGAGSAAGSALPPPEAPARTGAGARSRRPAAAARRAPSGAGRGSVKAKFPGRCRCGRPYDKGETITKNDDGWGHPACATAGA